MISPNEKLMRELGAKLKRYRLKQGVSMAKLGAAIGIGSHVQARLEIGHVRLSTFLAAADHLGLNVGLVPRATWEKTPAPICPVCNERPSQCGVALNRKERGCPFV